MENELLISGLQHFSFCRRQWALIHIEGEWSDNLTDIYFTKTPTIPSSPKSAEM